MNEYEDAARTKLTPDAWYQDDEGNYTVDCPECGSGASLTNVVSHGRCDGYLDQRSANADLDEQKMTCTAKLWFELGYVSDPDEDATSEAIGDTSTGHDEAIGGTSTSHDDTDDENGVSAEGRPEGTEGVVDDAEGTNGR